MTIFFLTLAAFATAMLIMAVGVIFKRPCLRGSCGGADILTADGDSLACATCPKRKERERKAAAERQMGERGLPVV